MSPKCDLTLSRSRAQACEIASKGFLNMLDGVVIEYGFHHSFGIPQESWQWWARDDVHYKLRLKAAMNSWTFSVLYYESSGLVLSYISIVFVAHGPLCDSVTTNLLFSTKMRQKKKSGKCDTFISWQFCFDLIIPNVGRWILLNFAQVWRKWEKNLYVCTHEPGSSLQARKRTNKMKDCTTFFFPFC